MKIDLWLLDPEPKFYMFLTSVVKYKQFYDIKVKHKQFNHFKVQKF